MKLSFVLPMAALVLMSAGQSAIAKEKEKTKSRKPGAAPTSEIPAKREFPLNLKGNACNDFHDYVCSEVEASFVLRPDRRMHGFAFSDSAERLLEDKKKFMANLDKATGLDARTQQIQDVYKSCMNTKARATDEKAFVKELVGEINAIKTPEELIAWTNNTMPKSLGGLYGFGAVQNVDNPSVIDGFLGSNLMLIPDHDYYEKADLVKDYKAVLATFFKSIEPKITAADAQKRADDLLAMQFEYIKTFPRKAEQRERWSKKTDISQKEFTAKFPHLQSEIIWAYLPKDLRISVTIPEGFEFIDKNINSIPLQVWKDYILYSSLKGILDEGYPQVFKKRFDFNKKYFGGPTQRPPIQERCTQEAEGFFEKEIDAALIDKLFPNFDEKKVIAVAETVRSSIIEGMKENKWLSKEGRKGAILKMEKARLQLVKPHNDREWDFVPQRKYSPTQYVLNQKTITEAQWEKGMKEVREPANQDAWGMGPLTVNAYYSPRENKFVMPMGILQYPFYVADGTLIENLGAVGSVVGHELGHGIDDQGAKYDFTGRLKAWMPEKDVTQFQARGEKLVKQFEAAGLNGKLTLGENSADLNGLTFAYKAAFPGGKGSVEDKQKFFVAYGRLWCRVVRPDFETYLKKMDPHADGISRINEQVKHQPAFAEAFSCKPGDKMVLPETERVQIW
jgi:Predicted metalloendopeptidase